MSVIGIVCEYNPFHTGHGYHMEMSKNSLNEEAPAICVMSGDFVQRGEAAVYSKFARAEAACRSGANLVIELPLPWALSSAENFARGSVAILDALGATHLSFGSESGDIRPLDNLAQILLDPGLNAEIKDIMNEDGSLSYAAARQIAVTRREGEIGELLEKPNNILGIEYIKAIYDLRLNIKPMTVERYGSGHDREFSGRGPKSASELRAMLFRGLDPSEHIPGTAFEVYKRERERGRELSNREILETAMLSRLRMLKAEDFEALPDGSDGIGRRLYNAAKEETSLDSILASTKTKRYALSRIRRMCLCAALGIKSGMAEGIPPYARVLAADSRGCELIKAATENGKIPLITKPASVKALSAEAREVFELGARAHDFYVLGYRAQAERRGGMDWRVSPVIIK